jgi:glucose-6-phosphate isomerase
MSFIHLQTRFAGDSLVSAATELLPKAQEHLKRIAQQTCVGSEWTGWYDYPKKQGFALADEIRRYVDQLDVSYDLVLVIGIGGSYLGTRAVTEALQHSYQGLMRDHHPMVAFAGHHLSESQLVELLELLEKRTPIVNVISKSGTTTEPGVVFRVIRHYIEERFGKEEAARRIVCTTDAKEGALRQVVREEGYASFVIPDDIGGRFSVLTPVGLLPLALLRFDIKALLEGADTIFSELNQSSAEHPVLRYATTRTAAFLKDKRIEVLAVSNPKLSHVVEWWKQLFGESEGKQGQGLFPAGLSYTTDLHSLGQYVQDGVRNILETFLSFEVDVPRRNGIEKRIRVPSQGSKLDGLGYLEGRFLNEINEAAMKGTMMAHFDGGVPCLQLTVPELNEKGIGALFAFFETACGISAALLDVNPYDQPGVEAYKKNLFALMGKPGTEALGAKLRERL